MMQLGDIRLDTVDGGRFRLDGGTMFGVVPKPLWQRVAPADEQNRVRLTANCLLVRTPRNTVLVDSGLGVKLTDKERTIYALDEQEPLLANLAAQQLSVEDIDTVIYSHLHFDHAGGGTRIGEDGNPRPTFPNAQYVVQRREWEVANCGLPEWEGNYPAENFACLQTSAQLTLIDGDAEIVPGISALVTGGHTPGHQVVVIRSGNTGAAYLGDICPTWNHLPRMWCMAYDADLIQTRRVKYEVFGQLADNGWIACSDHDPDHPMARLERDPRRGFVVAEFV